MKKKEENKKIRMENDGGRGERGSDGDRTDRTHSRRNKIEDRGECDTLAGEESDHRTAGRVDARKAS